MNLETLLQLEQRIDQLLAKTQSLDEECRRLREHNDHLLGEQERFCRELDRILAKLEPPQPGDR